MNSVQSGRCCMKLNSNNLVLRESGSEYSIKTFAFLMRPLADAQPQWNIFCFSYCINHETWQTKAQFLISIILDAKRGKIVRRNQYLGYTRGTLVEYYKYFKSFNHCELVFCLHQKVPTVPLDINNKKSFCDNFFMFSIQNN